jgi:hypothetical protein
MKRQTQLAGKHTLVRRIAQAEVLERASVALVDEAHSDTDQQAGDAEARDVLVKCIGRCARASD